MFVGWFKIEGHSKPKPRRGFVKLNKMLKDQQRLGNGTTSHRQSITDDRFRREGGGLMKIIQIVAAFSVVICLALIIKFWPQTGSVVINKMEENQSRLNGSRELISKVDLSIREAKKSYQLGDYEQSYYWYKEAYNCGAIKKEVYLGLYEVCERLCEVDQIYCDETQEWKEVIDRIDKESP
ncbi:MAG: hypothetical protein H6563_01105 [Lewinellaceae bacterium]|nr:hypothetical protein [Lewinellaceae bacterium]